jgi:exopolysaccharide production protein ExoQ
MSKFGMILERVFTVLSLIIYSGGILTLITSGGTGESDVEITYDTSIIRTFYFLIYLITFLLLVLRWRRVINVVNSDKYMWVLVFLPLISMLWSFDNSATLKDSFTIIGSSIFGLYLATRYSIKQQLELLAIAGITSMFLSTIFAVLLPSYGIMTDLHAGAWRGIHTHKNGLGQIMGLSSLVFIVIILDNKKNYYLWLGLMMSVTLLVLSRSTASMTNAFFVTPFFVILNALRLRYKLMIPTLLAIIIISSALSIWISDNAATLAGSVGKDMTLTGRTAVWEFVGDMVQKQPWLGYGYSGFWKGLDGPSAYVWRATQWNPTHPHNGLLQIWLDLGLLGVTIYLIVFWRYFIRAIAYVRSTTKIEGLWPMLYLIYVVLLNLTESSLFTSNSIIWILYVAGYCSLLQQTNVRLFTSLDPDY